MQHVKRLYILIFLLSTVLIAQEKADSVIYGWQKELVGNVNFTQNSFDNWVQGGENAWSWTTELRGKFVNDQQKYNWANSGKFIYGKSKIGSDESKKAMDEIKLESVYTYKLNLHINPYVAASGQSQFDAGYNYIDDTTKVEVSNFLDPAYFTESIGLGIEPVKDLRIRIGAALKQTIADKHTVPFSDDPETTKNEKLRSEVGIESVTDFSRKLNDIILFTTKLELFSNVKGLDEIDVNWDNLFTAKVSKYINVSFNFKLFYDKDISPKRQIQQTLAVGLTYSFF